MSQAGWLVHKLCKRFSVFVRLYLGATILWFDVSEGQGAEDKHSVFLVQLCVCTKGLMCLSGVTIGWFYVSEGHCVCGTISKLMSQDTQWCALEGFGRLGIRHFKPGLRTCQTLPQITTTLTPASPGIRIRSSGEAGIDGVCAPRSRCFLWFPVKSQGFQTRLLNTVG